MIEEGILALANAATPQLGGRFYADTLPRTVTYPAGIQRAGIAGRSERTLSGPGMQTDRYQFEFAGKSRLDVATAQEALIVAFQRLATPVVLTSGDLLEDVAYIAPIKIPYDDSKQVFWCGCEFYVKYNRVL